jgi:serine/threonine-protein kinase
MVTGKLPGLPPALPSLVNKDLDPVWDAFIVKATEKNPSDRYSDADGMLKDLDELERHWIKKKQSICSAPSWLFEDPFEDGESAVLRSVPMKIPAAMAEKTFDTDGLMRPSRYIRNRFVPHTDHTVKDLACNLVWQTAGSRFPVNRENALSYIERLNAESFAGLASWRLPTVNELLSLVERTPEGRGYCIESVFDSRMKSLWSCDRCTFITGWYVNHELGYAGFNDFDSFYHVKAVSSEDSEPVR